MVQTRIYSWWMLIGNSLPITQALSEEEEGNSPIQGNSKEFVGGISKSQTNGELDVLQSVLFEGLSNTSGMLKGTTSAASSETVLICKSNVLSKIHTMSHLMNFILLQVITLSTESLSILHKSDSQKSFKVIFNYSILGELYEDKTIYIYHDTTTKHYVYITAIKAFGSSFKGSNTFKFCSSCAWFYCQGQTCACKENPQSQPKQIVPMITCEDCQLKYYKYTEHKCHHKKCKFCTGIYKDTNAKEHRCPLYCAPNTKEFNETSEGNNSK